MLREFTLTYLISILSLNELINHADCVLPIDNQALMNICNNIENPVKGKTTADKTQNQMISRDDTTTKVSGSKIINTGEESKKEKPFDKMNNIIAHVLSNLTW